MYKVEGDRGFGTLVYEGHGWREVILSIEYVRFPNTLEIQEAMYESGSLGGLPHADEGPLWSPLIGELLDAGVAPEEIGVSGFENDLEVRNTRILLLVTDQCSDEEIVFLRLYV